MRDLNVYLNGCVYVDRYPVIILISQYQHISLRYCGSLVFYLGEGRVLFKALRVWSNTVC